MRIPILVLALALSGIGSEAKKKGPLPPRPGKVVFFFDDNCTKPSTQEILVIPSPDITASRPNSGKYYNGPTGSKSGWFTDTGDLTVWHLIDDPTSTSQFSIPNVKQCVTYPDGIYAAGAMGDPTKNKGNEEYDF